MLKHSRKADTGQNVEVDIPSKVTLGSLKEVEVVEDYYLMMDASQDEEEKSQHCDDLGSFHRH
jgi:hypothetical protein